MNTKVCQNCLQDIVEDNYLLHQLYCNRNIIQCDKCEEKIDLNEMNEHNKEHDPIECIYCKNKIEKRFFQTHNEQCQCKPRKCEYCELVINVEEYLPHIAKCGARTERCDVCNKNIKKIELQEHQFNCKKNRLLPQIKKKSPPKQQFSRLKKCRSDNQSSSSSSSSSSVQEIKIQQQVQPQEMRPNRRRPQPITQNIKQINDPDIEDEDEELQKAIQLSMKQK